MKTQMLWPRFERSIIAGNYPEPRVCKPRRTSALGESSPFLSVAAKKGAILAGKTGFSSDQPFSGRERGQLRV